MARRKRKTAKHWGNSPDRFPAENGDTSAPPDEDVLWAQAISDVTPLGGKPKAPARPQRPQLPVSSLPNEQFDELLETSSSFDLQESGERFSGRSPSVDRRILKKLSQGEPAPQAEVDLHRMHLENARETLGRFLEHSWWEGKRSVLVIHGRGIHGDGSGVIRRSLPEWLSTPPLCSKILCFCTARPQDGGTGATTILLRRGPNAPARR